MYKRFLGVTIVSSVMLFSGCATFVDNVKYNFIEDDIPFIENVKATDPKGRSLKDKQKVIEEIVGNKCITSQPVYMKFKARNRMIDEYVTFSECFEATDFGYRITHSNDLDMNKKGIKRWGEEEYIRIQNKVSEAKSKLNNEFPLATVSLTAEDKDIFPNDYKERVDSEMKKMLQGYANRLGKIYFQSSSVSEPIRKLSTYKELHYIYEGTSEMIISTPLLVKYGQSQATYHYNYTIDGSSTNIIEKK